MKNVASHNVYDNKKADTASLNNCDAKTDSKNELETNVHTDSRYKNKKKKKEDVCIDSSQF